MNDLDQDLQEMFRRHEADILAPVVAPPLIRRRTRRRQSVTIAAALLAVLGVAAVAIGARVISSSRRIPVGVPSLAPPASITTVAGTGVRGSSGDGGPATEARTRFPVDVATDAAGNLYILEFSRVGRVRMVDPSGRIDTVVGPPTAGAPAEVNGANRFVFRWVTALAIDQEGNLYLGGRGGNVNMVVEIHRSGRVSMVAGTGEPGYSGDGGPATDATLDWVYDIAVDANGDIFIADANNNRIRKVDASGVITTIAGTGIAGSRGDGGPAVQARLRHPTGVDVDARGNVYVADAWNGRIRRVDPKGFISTVAGGGTIVASGVPATDVELIDPEHVAIGPTGNLYIEDTKSHRILLVDEDGIVSTFVGTGRRGSSGDGGPPSLAQLWSPSGMTLASDGVLYIADSENDRVRRVVVDVPSERAVMP
jgi:hypothetical protein